MSRPEVLTEDHARQRRSVWVGLFIAILIDTGLQTFWKSAVNDVPASAGIWGTVVGTLQQPVFFLAIGLSFLQFFNWMAVLSKADLSYAQPVSALSMVTVSIAAMIRFHERISLQRAAGIGLILAGVWFISRTHHRTTPEKTPTQPREEVTSC